MFLPEATVSWISCRSVWVGLAERDGALQVEDQNVADLPIEVFQGHAATLSRLGAGVKSGRGLEHPAYWLKADNGSG